MTSPGPSRSPLDLGQNGNVVSDLKYLTPKLVLPWSEFRSMSWLRKPKWFGFLALATLPMIVYTGGQQSNGQVFFFWSTALCVCLIWMVFFHQFFNAGDDAWKPGIIAFFLTAVISAPTLVPLLTFVLSQPTTAPSPGSLFHFFTLMDESIPSSLVRTTVILLLLRFLPAKLTLPLMMFSGLCSGLAIAGVVLAQYQSSHWNLTDVHTYGFYATSVFNLSCSLLMGAILGGLTAYFFTAAHLFPLRRRGLWALGAIVPTAIDFFLNNPLPGNLYAWNILVSFFAAFLLLNLYFRRFELEPLSIAEPARASS